MKKASITRNLFIIAMTVLIISINSKAQSKPYLGQTPPGNTPVRLVPDSLAANSEWQYHGTPTFSPDGNEMYYAIYRFNPGRIEIWYTEYVDGKWVASKRAPFSPTSYGNNNPYFLNKDTLFFLSPRSNGFIFKVTRTNGVWSTPIALNLNIPIGYTTGWQFSIADNGNLYTELTSKNGSEDLYLWRFDNGSYQAPEKLTAICSAQLDFTPYIDPAERFIIFASRRPGGFGNTDLYISKKNSDNTWAAPINLGKEINTGDVISPIISRDGKYFFYEAWMPNAAGGNPYWMDANVIYNLITDIKNEQSNPTGYNLFQNYPNPFNPSTTIKYALNTQSHVKLNITNVLGEIVSEAINEVQEAGMHQYNFNAANLSSGIYFFQLVAGNYREVKKMVLLR